MQDNEKNFMNPGEDENPEEDEHSRNPKASPDSKDIEAAKAKARDHLKERSFPFARRVAVTNELRMFTRDFNLIDAKDDDRLSSRLKDLHFAMRKGSCISENVYDREINTVWPCYEFTEKYDKKLKALTDLVDVFIGEFGVCPAVLYSDKDLEEGLSRAFKGRSHFWLGGPKESHRNKQISRKLAFLEFLASGKSTLIINCNIHSTEKGPDNFRQINELLQETLDGKLVDILVIKILNRKNNKATPVNRVSCYFIDGKVYGHVYICEIK